MGSVEKEHGIKPLKVGLLNDSYEINHYIKDIIDWSKEQKTIQITHYIIHSDANVSDQKRLSFFLVRLFQLLKRNGIRQSCANVLLFSIRSLEYRYMNMKKKIHKNHLNTYDARDFGFNLIHTSPIASKSKFIHQFSEKDITMIQACHFDVLIRCGRPTFRGDILKAAKFGLISMYHGDNDFYLGSPAGFWEVYEKSPLTGFIIERLEAEDNAAILLKGLLSTKPYWLLNQAHIYLQANSYFKIFLKQLASTQTLPEPLPKHPNSHGLYKQPTTSECFNYIKNLITYYCNKLHRTGEWHVSFIRDHWQDAVLSKGIALPNEPGFELADPFLYKKDDKDYCFVEEINSKNGVGKIVVYEIGQHHATRLGTVLEEPFHLSFPFIFEYDGMLFMLPESSGNNDIRLYECTEFPLHWRLKHILMDNISAADSMLIPTHDRWWLLTNIDRAGINDHCSELSIFSAPTPLSDTWTPHPKNPIYIDASRARNGGFFNLGERLYRVSQSQGINIYGQSISINAIDELSFQAFREHCITYLKPQFKPRLQGIHHFHTTGNLSVFDYYEL